MTADTSPDPISPEPEKPGRELPDDAPDHSGEVDGKPVPPPEVDDTPEPDAAAVDDPLAARSRGDRDADA